MSDEVPAWLVEEVAREADMLAECACRFEVTHEFEIVAQRRLLAFAQRILLANRVLAPTPTPESSLE